MPYGKGTYGSKRGRPSKKAKAVARKKIGSKKAMMKKVAKKIVKKMARKKR